MLCSTCAPRSGSPCQYHFLGCFVENQLSDGIYSNLSTALRLSLTIPVTLRSSERCFNELKLIRNYLRSSSGEEWLSDLALLCTEREATSRLDYDEVIITFAREKVYRRRHFHYSFLFSLRSCLALCMFSLNPYSSRLIPGTCVNEGYSALFSTCRLQKLCCIDSRSQQWHPLTHCVQAYPFNRTEHIKVGMPYGALFIHPSVPTSVSGRYVLRDHPRSVRPQDKNVGTGPEPMVQVPIWTSSFCSAI